MKTKFSVHRIPSFLAISAIAVVAFGLNPHSLRAQAPAAAGTPQLPDTVENTKGKTAGEFYKNVQVLKDIPAADIRPAMDYIETALGVECEYCHVPDKNDSDDRHNKNIARSMIKMTIALNATVFDSKREITCNTCHRGMAKAPPTMLLSGETMPTGRTAQEIFPMIAVHDVTTVDSSQSPSKAPPTVQSGPPTPRPVATPVVLPSVDDVFNKYAQALGGDAVIAKVMSLVEKGTVDMMVPPPPAAPGTPSGKPARGTVPAEIDRKLPGMVLLSVEIPGRPPRMQGSNGTIAWINRREYVGSELALQQEFAEFPPGLKFREAHNKVLVDAKDKVGDHEVYRVVGTRKDGTAVDLLYFDQQTGLLLRSYTTIQTVLGGNPQVTYYDDYRDASGLKVPFTMRVVTTEGDRTYKWSQVNVNAPVEGSRFMMPPPPPPRPAAD
jgi:photosynthetic reaction center cytochrome c subunit